MGSVTFVPSSRFKNQVEKPRKRRKRRVATSADIDPNVKKKGRLYEVTYYSATAENVVVTKWRIRVKDKGLEDNVYDVGTDAHYFGMVEEHILRDKWSPIGFGWLPVSNGYVREVIEPASKPTPIGAKSEPQASTE